MNPISSHVPFVSHPTQLLRPALLHRSATLLRIATLRTASALLLLLLLLQILVPGLSVPVQGYERFEVQTFGGVPMMTLDGVPTRARIFWGRPGSRTLQLTNEFQKIKFDFRPCENSRGIGTMHFRFGKEPGSVVIDDYLVVEKASGKVIAGPYHFEETTDFTAHWRTWQSQFEGKTIAELKVVPGCGVNGSSALKVEIQPGNEALSTDFHLYHEWNMDLKPELRYEVSFAIRSSAPRAARISFYRAENPHVSLGGFGDVLESQTRLASEVGVNFVSFMVPKLWPEADGTIDFTGMDQQIERILDANPHALIIPRLPLNVRDWWLKANPSEQMVWYHFDEKSPGENYGTNWATPCSLRYRHDACETLRAAIRHLEAKYGNSIAGYHPAGQNTQEWFTINTWRGGHADYSPAAQTGFRLWLRKKYAADANLRKAWGRPDVTLETAQVPAGELRDQSLQFYVIDPALNPDAPQEFQSIVDFNEFFQQQMTATILDLARVVKEETSRRKLCVFFYGYCYEFSGCAKGPAASAHYDLRALLDSPDVDLIASPISYFDRQPGGGGSCMLNAESVTAAGKIYVYEDDTSTFLAVGNRAPGWENGSETYEGTRNLLLRNTAESTVRNLGIWWMDLGGAGWFDSPDLWKIMTELREMDEFFLRNPTPYQPEVAVFIDEKSMLKVGSGRFTARSVSHLRRSLNRLGTPYAQYLLDDLFSGHAKPPLACVVTNTEALTAAQKAKITAIANAASSKVIWVTQEGISPEKLREEIAQTNVRFFTQELCNVWANAHFVLLHAPEDGDYHLNSDMKFRDVLTDEPVPQTISLKRGETRVLKFQ